MLYREKMDRLDTGVRVAIANVSPCLEEGRFSVGSELTLSKYAGYTPLEMFHQSPFPAIKEVPYTITLGPYGYYWLSLNPKEPVGLIREEEAHKLVVERRWDQVFFGKHKKKLEREILPEFIKKARWFEHKTLTIHYTKIILSIPLAQSALCAALASKLDSRIVTLEESNSSCIFGESFFLKLYRRLDEGIHPEVELERYLTQESDFSSCCQKLGRFFMLSKNAFGSVSMKMALHLFLGVLLLSGICFAEEYQRTYLATYPRSGNHWMRYLIEEATHIATSSVYCDPDPPHQSTIYPWMGYCVKFGYDGTCRYPEPGEVVVVKTHFPSEPPKRIGDLLPYAKAIHIVRHPIDSMYSYYLYRKRPTWPEIIPRDRIKGYCDSMRKFDEYWSNKENVLDLRYEDLLQDPYSGLKGVLEHIGYQVSESDIARAVAKYPPQGCELKHILRFPHEDLEYIASELQELMQKYDYHIPGIN